MREKTKSKCPKNAIAESLAYLVDGMDGIRYNWHIADILVNDKFKQSLAYAVLTTGCPGARAQDILPCHRKQMAKMIVRDGMVDICPPLGINYSPCAVTANQTDRWLYREDGQYWLRIVWDPPSWAETRISGVWDTDVRRVAPGRVMESIVEYDKAVFRGGRNTFVKMACSPTAFSYEIAAIEPYCGGRFRRKKDMPFDLEYDEGDAHWRTQNR
jgi:hypothetical protein